MERSGGEKARACETNRDRLFWMNQAAALLLLVWIIYDAAGHNLMERRLWAETFVDFRILYGMSHQVIHDQAYRYPPIYPYPPSAVVLFGTAALLPFHMAASIWMVLTILSTAGVVILGISLLGLKKRPYRWLVALAAYALADYYIQWDLRSQNCNMVTCFLLAAAIAALHYRRNTLAGAALAVSIALKLYPMFLLPYLLLTGRRQAFIQSTCFLTLFLILFPTVVFGPAGCLHVYQTWFEELRYIAGALHSMKHPILIAPSYTFATQTGTAVPYSGWLLLLLNGLWLCAVTICLLAGRFWKKENLDSWNLVVDCGVLALAPVVMSPYLEAYHVAPCLLLLMALIQKAADSQHDLLRRLFAVVALAAGWYALKLSGAWGHRGMGVYIQMTLLVLALALFRLPPLKRFDGCKQTFIQTFLLTV